MCCIKLDARIILNNFFGSPNFSQEMKEKYVERKTIDQCSIFISNNLPGYVICDLSDEAIEEAVADGDVGYDFVKKSFIFKHEINREIYNQFYPRVVAKELEEIVDYFLKRKLYKERVEPIKTLIG